MGARGQIYAQGQVKVKGGSETREQREVRGWMDGCREAREGWGVWGWMKVWREIENSTI